MSFQIPDTKRYGKCGIKQARNMSIIINMIGYRQRGEEASGTNNGEHIVERAITVNIVGIKKLGSWLNWEVAGTKPSWNNNLIKEPQWLEFQLKFVYDMLPTTTILPTKGKRNDSNCILCYRQANSSLVEDKHEDIHVTRFSPFLHTCFKRQGKDLRRSLVGRIVFEELKEVGCCIPSVTGRFRQISMDVSNTAWK